MALYGPRIQEGSINDDQRDSLQIEFGLIGERKREKERVREREREGENGGKQHLVTQ